MRTTANKMPCFGKMYFELKGQIKKKYIFLIYFEDFEVSGIQRL